MAEYTYGPLTFVQDSSKNYLAVSRCDPEAVNVVIPEHVHGVPVIAILNDAFSGCKKLESVSVPDITDTVYDGKIKGFEICDQAFAECRALKKVELPYCVSSIGHGAFRECESLTEIKIPDCYVGPYAFARCYSLKQVNPIDIISDGVFSHCKSLESFPVLAGTKCIGEDAFEHCYALTEAFIPASVNRIESLAFRNCHALKSVTFEDPENWYSHSHYTGEDYPKDVYDPERNAQILRNMDFDDGVGGWFKMDPNAPPKKSLDEILKEIEELMSSEDFKDIPDASEMFNVDCETNSEIDETNSDVDGEPNFDIDNDETNSDSDGEPRSGIDKELLNYLIYGDKNGPKK